MNLCYPDENGNAIDYCCNGYYEREEYRKESHLFTECDYFERHEFYPKMCKWVAGEPDEWCECKKAQENALLDKRMDDL